MSGGLLRIRLPDGDVYEMPEQEAFAAMADLEKGGVKYDATEVAQASGGLDPSTQPDALPDGSTGQPRDIPLTHSAARGFMHGATMGLYDAKIPGVGKSFPEVFGEEPYDQVRAAHPTANVAGDVVGSIASPVGKLGQAAKGAGFVARGVRGGLAGAGESGVRALAEGEDPEKAAATGGGVSAAVSSIAPAIGKGIGAIGDKAGELFGAGADKARLYAAGLGDESVAKALADRLGVSALPKDLAALVERITPSSGRGMSATERATELGGELNTIGDQLGNKYDYAGKTEGLDAFVPGAWSAIAQRMGLKARAVPEASAGERALRGAMESNAAGVAAEAPPSSLRGLVGRKSAWQGEGHSGPGGNVPDVGSKQAAADMGRVAKEELEDVLQYATPQTQLETRALNRDFQVRAALQEAAESAPKDNVPGWLPRVGGAIVGGAAGGALSGPGGAVLGAGSGAMYGARAASSVTGTRGADYWANIGRMLERNAPAVGDGARDVGNSIGNQGTRFGNLISDAADGAPPLDEEELRRLEEEANR